MNFSNTIKYSGICSYSSNGNYLAIVKGSSLIIYITIDLKILQKFTFSSPISHIAWSPDNTLILIAFYKNGIVEIKSLNNPQWNCTINDSSSGITYARWTPDSRKVIIANDFAVRFSIWSLVDKSTVYINAPKYCDKGISFSSNGYFMALAERKDNKDHIGIYFTGDWSLVSHFPVDSYDLNDIVWSKDNTSIVVFDSELECKLLVYSPTGNLMASHEPYTGQLGIATAKYSPNGSYIACGMNDNTVRLFNHFTMKQVTSLNHYLNQIQGEIGSVFKEEEISVKNKTSRFIECDAPYKFPVSKGVNFAIEDIQWSYDSCYLATRSEYMSNALLIWEVNSLKLYTVIITIKPIKDFQWSPKENMLLIVTENAKMYTFTLSNVYIVELVSDMSGDFGALKVIWNNDGKSFIVSDKKQMIIGHPEIGEEDQQNIEDEEEEDQKNDLRNPKNEEEENENLEVEEENN